KPRRDRRHRRHVLGLEHHAGHRRQRHARELPQEVEMPEVAPEFAVGHHPQAQRLLPSHRLTDAPVLHLAQRGGADGAGLGLHARLVQLAWTQEAPDVLGAKRWRHRCSSPLRPACTMHEMLTRLVAVLLLVVATVAYAAAPTPPGAEWLREQVKLLSAPDMDGRGSGTPGAD